MAQLNVRLDDDTREAFDALARARGLSASDLARSLIDVALGRDDPERGHGDPTPVSLSAVERRSFALQYEILARLDALVDDEHSEVASYRSKIDVLDYGFTTEYRDLFVAVQPEMTRRECSLVHDVLDMFTTVQSSLERLSSEDREALGEHADVDLTFRGFDFSDSFEGRLASYAEHVIKDGRWASMAVHFDAAHDHGNSHAPLLASYERMLSIWRPLWRKKAGSYAGPEAYLLTPGELRSIADVRAYPRA